MLTFEDAFKKMMYESYMSDDDLREDEIYNESFERNLREALLSFITYDTDDEVVEEEYKSNYQLRRHFNSHCIAYNQNKVSKGTNVFYDFTDIDDYKNRVEYVDNRVPDCVISNLGSKRTIEEAIRKLSGGNYCIYFNERCNIPDNDPNSHESDVVSIKINAFANDVTTNFRGGNTADFVIYGEGGITKTQYAISLQKMMNKLNALMQ